MRGTNWFPVVTETRRTWKGEDLSLSLDPTIELRDRVFAESRRETRSFWAGRPSTAAFVVEHLGFVRFPALATVAYPEPEWGT